MRLSREVVSDSHLYDNFFATIMSTTETDRPRSEIPDRAATLVLTFSTGSRQFGHVYSLQPGETPIGREITDAAGISLQDDGRCSRRHACIEVKRSDAGQAVFLHDERSKNGTFLNGTRIERIAIVTDGDVIRVGNSIFILRVADAVPVDSDFPRLVGRAPVMGRLRHRLAEAALSSVPVLLLGEPGVGKEAAARSIHEKSRRPGSFVACNCAGLTESLADSLLFGHERGAFSGAIDKRDGLFRAADHGTLFLDEVGELSASVQAKLLRALQEHEILPVGRTRPIQVNVRVLAATNRDLDQGVRDGDFRDDLLSRLRGTVLQLPALREHREDVLVLLAHMLGGKPRLTPRLAEALLLYHWPHNVRELAHIAEALRAWYQAGSELDLPLIEERLQVRGKERQKTQEAHPLTSGAQRAAEEPSSLTHCDVDTRYQPKLSRETLERLGRETNWNISRLSRVLGLSRRQIRRWLDKYGLARVPNTNSLASAHRTPPDEPPHGESSGSAE